MCLEKLVEHMPFTLPELKAFIGLVIIVAVTEGQNKSINQLWSNEWGQGRRQGSLKMSGAEASMTP